MVSKITNFDYRHASRSDYASFAQDFYKILAKKYHLKIKLNFMYYPNTAALTISAFWNDSTDKFCHYITVNMDDFFSAPIHPFERFFNFIEVLYHELYHVLIIEQGTLENCFDINSLFANAVKLIDGRLFWRDNYRILDEELNAYSFSIKKTYQFINKYYSNFPTYHLPQEELKKCLTMKHFYNFYYYDKEISSKMTTLYRILTNVNFLPSSSYTAIINKIYNKEQDRLKTIDELFNDLEYFGQKYADSPKKLQEIKHFYTILITEKFRCHEKFRRENNKKMLNVLSYSLQLEKKKLNELQQIHPVSISLMQKRISFIKQQESLISNEEKGLNALKSHIF